MEHDHQNVQSASLWRRLAAILYDSFLVLAIAFLVGFINLAIQLAIFGKQELKQMTESGYSMGGLPFNLVLFLSVLAFFVFFWSRSGQTLGMKAWQLKIQNNSGGLPSLQQCLIRWVVAIPALLLFGLGLIWCLVDPDKRSWQDRLSNTKTVHTRKN